MADFKISHNGQTTLVHFDCDETTTMGDFLQWVGVQYGLVQVRILKLVKGQSIDENSVELLVQPLMNFTGSRAKRITVVGVVPAEVEELESRRVEQERKNEIAEVMNKNRGQRSQGKQRPKTVRIYAYGPETKQNQIDENGRRRYGFTSATVRKELAKADQAMRMVYSIVNDPALLKVMEKYRWHVDLVKEITPWEEPTKLGWNMNRGQNIALRLRSGREYFLSREEIMETMFHELAHMEIGPHNDAFNELNDQIREDYFDFAYTIDEPEAFTGIGIRLGGSRAHRDVSPNEMARRAALSRHVALLTQSSCTYDYDHDHHHNSQGHSHDHHHH